ncbi:MAG: SIS domain-containing protein [Eubacteriales bacterium]|nr:SIS domain-containing protein [Eubacteriales bacterium]
MVYDSYIKDYIDKERELLNLLDCTSISSLLLQILNAYEQEAAIYIFGNGGSAATASHFANDFNKGISEYTDKKFRFCCLNDNIPTVMAIANDIGYENVFEFQLAGKVKENDLVIGISGSGNSDNVVRAVRLANQAGAMTAGICGFSGGALANEAKVVMHVPCNNMQLVEDIHMILCHTMMSACYQMWNIKTH